MRGIFHEQGTKSHSLQADDGQWANKRQDADRASSLHGTQGDANAAAREMLQNQGGGELTTMGRNHRIVSKDTIAPGHDPAFDPGHGALIAMTRIGRPEPKPRDPTPSAVHKPRSRAVPALTRLFLYVKAGGRCEFDGCNAYLLEHHVTKGSGNFAEMAHIWAFSEGGPRSEAEPDAGEVHDISNLMLLCPVCHKLVDTRTEEFTAPVLRSHKRAHEDRIFQLTDTKPDRGTVAVAMRTRVAGKTVTVTLPEIQAAIAPRYCGDRCVHDIDLTTFDDRPTPEFWKIGAETIRKRMTRFYETPFDKHVPHHVSVFALAPIPLLMTLGSTLSDKVPTSLYQRHRDLENWVWKKAGQTVEFVTTRTRAGSDPQHVALVVSVSGVVAEQDLPPHVDETYFVYVLAPANAKPDRSILNLEESLQAFRSEYQRMMRMLLEEHPGLKSVDVFPAVPAPAAVAMGRDLLSKRDPVLVVYDFDKANGGFVRTLQVNANDER